jgi:hypothetical protein
MNSNKMSVKDLTIKFTDFVPSNLSFTDLVSNERSKGQGVGYVRYKNPKTDMDVSPFIQLPFIKLSTYGIPRIDDYHQDDSKRTYIKLPLDQSLEEVKNFSNLLKQIDEYLDTDEMRQKLKLGSKYRYVGLYRVPDEDEKPKNNNKKVGPRYPYIKIKLNTTYPDNHVLTQVYKSTLNKESNKRDRTLITDITTIDDLTKHASYLSNVRLIVRPVKLWSATKPDKTYGLTFKVMKIEYEPSEKTNNFSKEYLASSDVFVDNSDDETQQQQPQQQQPEPVKKHVPKTLEVNSDDSDDEPIVSKVAKLTVSKVDVSKVAVSKVAEVDSDDSDDEQVKPSKPQPPKILEVSSDSSDSSDSEPVVKKNQPPLKVNDSDDDKQVVKTVRKPLKVEVESDDSDLDDKPVKTVKPVPKGNKPKK